MNKIILYMTIAFLSGVIICVTAIAYLSGRTIVAAAVLTLLVFVLIGYRKFGLK